MDDYQYEETNRTNNSVSSACFIINHDDNTNYKKIKIILGQAIPSSGSGFLMCCSPIINLYYLAAGDDTDPALIAGFGLGNFLINALY